MRVSSTRTHYEGEPWRRKTHTCTSVSVCACSVSYGRRKFQLPRKTHTCTTTTPPVCRSTHASSDGQAFVDRHLFCAGNSAGFNLRKERANSTLPGFNLRIYYKSSSQLHWTNFYRIFLFKKNCSNLRYQTSNTIFFINCVFIVYLFDGMFFFAPIVLVKFDVLPLTH
jgi:hypothetical protein